jgi:hypothetical protein
VSAETDPYERLVELAERELEHAGRAELIEMQAVIDERNALVASLPARAPAGARDALERALVIQERVTIELLRGREETIRALANVRRGQRAAIGYARSLPPRHRRRDLLA